MTPTPATKICNSCGKNVAGKPRVKDREGRYFCETCFSKVSEAGKKSEASISCSSSVSNERAESDRPPDGVVVPGESGRLVMRRAAADSPLAFAEPEDRQNARETELELCPDCGAAIRRDADLCVSCGFNRATGRAVGRTFDTGEGETRRRVRACSKCGYDLHGLRTAKCPECGHINIPRGRSQFVEKEPRTITRWTYLAPTGVIVAAVAAHILLDLAAAGSVLRAGVFLAAACSLGVPIQWLLTWLWIDNKEPWYVTVLDTVAVYAGANALVWIAVGLTDSFTWLAFHFYLVPALFLHAVLFRLLAGLDWRDSFVSALPAAVIAIAVGWASLLIT